MISFYDYLILSHLPLRLQWQIDRNIFSLDELENIKYELQLARTWVEQDIPLLSKYNIKTVCYLDENYPSRLRDLDDAPFVLFYKGSIEKIEKSISIVGPRKIGYYGTKDAKNISYYFTKLGYSIVSGLAFGSDAIAQSMAAKIGGTTFGILSCGHLIEYPKNSNLKEQVLENGALISELWPTTKVIKQYIPYRNRIIAALSDNLVLIDCPAKSGTRTTLFHALNLSREIYIAPNAILGSNSDEIIRLIEEGAHILKF